jgi:hypothetical protein
MHGITRKKLLTEYGRALRQRSAAVFIGAGMSKRAGYPTWRELFDDVIKDLDLDSANCDLTEVAQFLVNKAHGRTHINKLIMERFLEKKVVPKELIKLAGLPVTNVWTTNYDPLIESAFRVIGKDLTVVYTSAQLMQPYKYPTVLYKMHGSVDEAASCVISKQDFETYARDKPAFLNLLSADYVGKTFLFLGLSFSDPNLNHVLSTSFAVFKENQRQHFAVLPYPQRSGSRSRAQFEYERKRFEYWVDDLGRYGISVYVVESFDQIDGLVEELANECNRLPLGDSVYVNGSFGLRESGRPRIETLCRRVGVLLADRDKRLVSGLGPVVGTSTLRGFIERLGERGVAMHGRLQVGSIRKDSQGESSRRRKLLEQCGTWILIGGDKGTRADVEITRSLPGWLIPIPGTGGAADWAAHEILKEHKDTPEYRLVAELDRAKFSVATQSAKGIEAVIEILDRHLCENSRHPRARRPSHP